MWNICSFEHMMGGMKSTTDVVYMSINILIGMENHVEFDEAIFQEKYTQVLEYWTG